jgi:hypothetical protein
LVLCLSECHSPGFTAAQPSNFKHDIFTQINHCLASIHFHTPLPPPQVSPDDLEELDAIARAISAIPTPQDLLVIFNRLLISLFRSFLELSGFMALRLH